MSNTAKELRDLIARAEIELAKLEKLPVEPGGFGDASVIRFKFQYHNTGRVYDFAAVRADSLWYLTGKVTRGFAWPELFEYFEARGKIFDLQVMMPYETLEYTTS